MKRSGRIARTSPLRSSGRIATRTPMSRATPGSKSAAKKAAKFEREFGSEARVRWIKYALPCVGCGRVPSDDYPNDNAHTANEGKSRKGHHSTIVPLCAISLRGIGCHSKYDRHLWPFDTALARDTVKVHARFTAAQWERMGNPEPIGSVVPRVVAALRDGSEE